MFSLYALFAPAEPGPDLFPHIDKVAHFTIFLTLAATSRWRWGRSWTVLALVAAYAPLSELLQATSFIGRDGDPLDAVADLCGATVGWLTATRLLTPARSRGRGVP